MKVYDFLPELVSELETQLKEDELRWGDTWLKRTKKGQEERTRKTFNDYFDRFEMAGVPVPWLKIIGNAFICWIRERHPEVWPE